MCGDNRENLGGYVVGGGPGRPKGSKNKSTVLKERLLGALDEVDARLKEQDPTALSWLAERLMSQPESMDAFLLKLIPEAKEVAIDKTGDSEERAANFDALPPIEKLAALKELITLMEGHLRALPVVEVIDHERD